MTSFPSSDHRQLPSARTGQAYSVCGVSANTGSLFSLHSPSSPHSQALNRIIYSCCLFLIFITSQSVCMPATQLRPSAGRMQKPSWLQGSMPTLSLSALYPLARLNPLISVTPSSLSISLTFLFSFFLSFASLLFILVTL